MTLNISPEISEYKKENGKLDSVPDNQHKQWRANNFSLSIPGLDCRSVTKIEGMVVKQTFVENPQSEKGKPNSSSPVLDISNLVFYVPESDAASFFAWHEDFVIKGNNTEDQEKMECLHSRMDQVKAKFPLLVY